MGTAVTVAARIACLVMTVLALAACGGGDDTDEGAVSTRTSTSTLTDTDGSATVVRTVTQVVTVRQPPKNSTTPVTVTTPEATANPRPVATGRPRFNVVLTGASHSAQPGRPWSYVVRATKRGRPTLGTAKMRVYADGKLVDTMGFFTFEGELRRTHVFPRILGGKRVIVQAEVDGEGGTRRVNWPVTVG